MQRIEMRLQELEAASDLAIRESARDLVQALMDFHRPGISRMVEALPGVADLAREEAVGPLLLLYDLHPESFETRVRDAVSRMAGVELLSLSGGVVRLRARRGMAVEDAIYAGGSGCHGCRGGEHSRTLRLCAAREPASILRCMRRCPISASRSWASKRCRMRPLRC